MYHFQVTVTLTSEQSISLILFEVGISKFGVWMHLGMTKCRLP